MNKEIDLEVETDESFFKKFEDSIKNIGQDDWQKELEFRKEFGIDFNFDRDEALKKASIEANELKGIFDHL